MSRARQGRLLAGPTVRLASWRALPAAGALAIAMVQLFSAPPVIELRLAAIALCVAAAFVLDDPAAQTLAASPTPLLFRRLLRTTLVLALLAALWMTVLWSAGEHVMTALTLELVTMLVVTLAAAAVATPRVPDGRGGVAAAPALLVILSAALLLLPAAWTLFVLDPADPAWQESHVRWALLLAIAVAAFLAASRDPANPAAGRPGHRLGNRGPPRWQAPRLRWQWPPDDPAPRGRPERAALFEGDARRAEGPQGTTTQNPRNEGDGYA